MQDNKKKKSHITIFIKNLEPKSFKELKYSSMKWRKKCIEIRDRRLEISFAKRYGNYLLENYYERHFTELHLSDIKLKNKLNSFLRRYVSRLDSEALASRPKLISSSIFTKSI